MPKVVIFREFAKVGHASSAPGVRLENALSCLAAAAACCVVMLGGWPPQAIATDLAVIPLAPDRIAHGRTAVSSRIPNGTVHPNTGLKSVIPLPDRSLLEPEREPDCTFKGPPSTPTTAEEMRMKLDYEQQCYRQSGSITRERMKRLQDAVEEMIKAVENR